MSGFGVIVHWGGQPADLPAERLADGIRHRGPDGCTTRTVGEATLVNAQFITTPEAALEAQPLRHCERDWWLTADARIDNRDELRRELEGRVAHPLVTDADFILAAYERWGTQLARHLIGDFAFAIWNNQDRSLLLVRDHLGIRPLYWGLAADGLGFVAASTLRAVLEACALPLQPDLAYIGDYATFSGTDVTHTCWLGVNRLAPAHQIEVSPDNAAGISRYWELKRRVGGSRNKSAEELAPELRRIFDEAVQCRLRAREAVGVQLSGGFDSTSVAATAAQLSVKPPIAFSLRFPGLSCDEGTYIDAALAHIGLRSESVDALSVPSYDFAAECKRSMDLPTLPDTQWHSALAASAVASGCRVVLTGQGGDHALGGSRTDWASCEIRHGRVRSGWSALRGSGMHPLAAVRKCVADAVRANALRYEGGRFERNLSRSLHRRAVLRLTAQCRLLDPRVESAFRHRLTLTDAPFPSNSITSASRRGVYQSSLTWFAELWDRSAASAGLELRHPFLDVRLVEFVAFLDENAVSWSGNERGLHLLSLGDRLPFEVAHRTDKAEFGEPWLRTAFLVWRSLAPVDPKVDAHLVRGERMRAITDNTFVEEPNAPTLWQLWGAVSSELWRRTTRAQRP